MKHINKWASVLLNLNMAGLCAVLALSAEPGWQRDWLWFVAGLLIGFAAFWLIFERYAERSRAKMRDEMNAIGAQYVQAMHQAIAAGQVVPLPPNFDQPPRMH